MLLYSSWCSSPSNMSFIILLFVMRFFPSCLNVSLVSVTCPHKGFWRLKVHLHRRLKQKRISFVSFPSIGNRSKISCVPHLFLVILPSNRTSVRKRIHFSCAVLKNTHCFALDIDSAISANVGNQLRTAHPIFLDPIPLGPREDAFFLPQTFYGLLKIYIWPPNYFLGATSVPSDDSRHRSFFSTLI